MDLPLRINKTTVTVKVLPTTGKFMIEAVNDTSFYFRLLVSTILLQHRNFSQLTLGCY